MLNFAPHQRMNQQTGLLFGIVFVLSGPLQLMASEIPAEVLDLSAWKVTLPADLPERKGSPDEIRQPQLKTFIEPGAFFVNENGKGVVFRAISGAMTTVNSKYPRSELREMTADGSASAAWNTNDDHIHTMTLQQAVTKTPEVKPHVVCAQIHDKKDDVMMVRLEGQRLFIERNKTGDVELDTAYVLGTSFNLRIEAGNGRVKVWYNDVLSMDWETVRTGCYFKAGCYTQSNVEKGDKPDAYGEVVITALAISHQVKTITP